ncbi:Nuclear pore complex protein NUP98A [Zea mays]|uniref:Nuclear pore complex protein NUP98A n=1 Tax=Zea mays TaxID=4577 RepID=A0A1D6F2P5_MAIZE|nr:Nuclear pore complex protein NUP98A [Zea mays]
MFGSSAFGTSATGFGTSGTTAFGVSSTTPGFGSSSTPSFGTSASAFSFGSSPSFGQTAVSSGSTPFGTTPSPFGAPAPAFGSQTAAPTFGQPQFANQAGGTRIKPYSQTPDVDSATSGTQPAAKLDSISAMPEYKEKSHEELRWEDYQRGDKGGPNTSGTQTLAPSFPSPIQHNTFASTSNPFSTNPFSTNNPFAPKPTTTTSSPFNTSFNNASVASSSLFTSSPGTTMFGQPAFAQPTSSTPAFSSGSLFGSTNPGSLFTSSGPSLFSTPTFQPSAPAQSSNMFSFQPPIQPGQYFIFKPLRFTIYLQRLIWPELLACPVWSCSLLLFQIHLGCFQQCLRCPSGMVDLHLQFNMEYQVCRLRRSLFQVDHCPWRFLGICHREG